MSTAFDGYSVGAAADEEEKTIPQVCSSLDAAPEAPDKDRDFLKTGGAFTDACIEVMMKAATTCRASTHLPKFRMYCPPRSRRHRGIENDGRCGARRLWRSRDRRSVDRGGGRSRVCVLNRREALRGA
ncbi:glutamine synthetase [Rhodanobacter denitrificans]|nr:glutamine synthetase [Rhodanobacter denitrificans]